MVLAEEGLCGAAGGWRLEAGGYSVLLSLFHQTVFSEIPSLVLTTGKAEVSALHTKQELVLSILVVLGMEETALHSLPFLIVRLPPALMSASPTRALGTQTTVTPRPSAAWLFVSLSQT